MFVCLEVCGSERKVKTRQDCTYRMSVSCAVLEEYFCPLNVQGWESAKASGGAKEELDGKFQKDDEWYGREKDKK